MLSNCKYLHFPKSVPHIPYLLKQAPRHLFTVIFHATSATLIQGRRLFEGSAYLNVLANKFPFSLSNRPHFLCVYRRDKPRGMLGEHEKSL